MGCSGGAYPSQRSSTKALLRCAKKYGGEANADHLFEIDFKTIRIRVKKLGTITDGGAIKK